MEQTSMFDELGVTVPKKNAAADENRKISLTCWKHCKYCDPNLQSRSLAKPALRIYRLCTRVGSECYPKSEVCEWSDLFDDVKPQTPGWTDY